VGKSVELWLINRNRQLMFFKVSYHPYPIDDTNQRCE